MIPTIYEAAGKIRKGELNPVALLEQCFDRIDKYEAKVKAWVFVDREGARAQAVKLAGELKAGRYRGPLHGIPIGIKDIFDVFDWPTAAGSELWKNAIARADCTVVKRLRQAGAVIMGKTVTTQYASFDPPVTRNPWNLERTPGGSSSGSAAAVACGMCLGAMGSQTGGSITRPASFCGVAGCKPTYGRVPLTGIVPLAHSMDHPGPIGRCVRDLAIMLQVIAGQDQSDPTSTWWPVPDYLFQIERQLEPPRLGLVRGLFADLAEPDIQETMAHCGARFAEKGATLNPVALPAAFSEVIARHRIVMAVEAAAFHGERLARNPEDYGPSIRQLLKEGLDCPAPEYAQCKEHQQQLKKQIEQCFREVGALLCPATRGPAPNANTTGDPAFNSPWSYTGLPSVSIPAGFSSNGMPLSIQLVGPPLPAGESFNLFAAAAWCEQVLAFEPGVPKGI